MGKIKAVFFFECLLVLVFQGLVQSGDDCFSEFFEGVYAKAGEINTPEFRQALLKVMNEVDAQSIQDFLTAVQNKKVTEEGFEKFISAEARNSDKVSENIELFYPAIAKLPKKEHIAEMFATLKKMKEEGYDDKKLSEFFRSKAGRYASLGRK